MRDLHNLMTEAAPNLTPTSHADVDADIARGRRSLRVRRTRRAFGATGIAAAALVGVLGVVASNNPSPAGLPEAGTSVMDADGVALVAYSGEQPTGFELAVAPSGWTVQASTPDRVVLAPPGARNQDSTDWVGKIGIQLSSDATPDLTDLTVRINGNRAVVAPGADGDSSTLYVKQDQGWLVVQAWQNLDWDAKRLIEFGRGITVTNAAETTGG